MRDRLPIKRITASVLLAASCYTAPFVSASQSSEENARQQGCSDFQGPGEVNTWGVRLRNGAGTGYGVEISYQTGDQVTIDGGVFGENVNGDNCWLSVTGPDGRSGYILSEYVTQGGSQANTGGDLGIIQTQEQLLPSEYNQRVLCEKTGIYSSDQITGVILQSNPTPDFMNPDYGAYSTSIDLGPDPQAIDLLNRMEGRRTWKGYGWYNQWGYEGVDYRVPMPTYADRIIIQNTVGAGDVYLLIMLPGYIDAYGYSRILPLDPNSEAYIWVFTLDRLTNPFADSNGQHEGVHPPCPSVAVPQSEIMPFLQQMN